MTQYISIIKSFIFLRWEFIPFGGSWVGGGVLNVWDFRNGSSVLYFYGICIRSALCSSSFIWKNPWYAFCKVNHLEPCVCIMTSSTVDRDWNSCKRALFRSFGSIFIRTSDFPCMCFLLHYIMETYCTRVSMYQLEPWWLCLQLKENQISS